MFKRKNPASQVPTMLLSLDSHQSTTIIFLPNDSHPSSCYPTIHTWDPWWCRDDACMSQKTQHNTRVWGRLMRRPNPQMAIIHGSFHWLQRWDGYHSIFNNYGGQASAFLAIGDVNWIHECEVDNMMIKMQALTFTNALEGGMIRGAGRWLHCTAKMARLE